MKHLGILAYGTSVHWNSLSEEIGFLCIILLIIAIVLAVIYWFIKK